MQSDPLAIHRRFRSDDIYTVLSRASGGFFETMKGCHERRAGKDGAARAQEDGAEGCNIVSGDDDKGQGSESKGKWEVEDEGKESGRGGKEGRQRKDIAEKGTLRSLVSGGAGALGRRVDLEVGNGTWKGSALGREPVPSSRRESSAEGSAGTSTCTRRK